jgi:hypothetical protein
VWYDSDCEQGDFRSPHPDIFAAVSLPQFRTIIFFSPGNFLSTSVVYVYISRRHGRAKPCPARPLPGSGEAERADLHHDGAKGSKRHDPATAPGRSPQRAFRPAPCPIPPHFFSSFRSDGGLADALRVPGIGADPAPRPVDPGRAHHAEADGLLCRWQHHGDLRRGGHVQNTSPLRWRRHRHRLRTYQPGLLGRALAGRHQSHHRQHGLHDQDLGSGDRYADPQHRRQRLGRCGRLVTGRYEGRRHLRRQHDSCLQRL